MTSRSTFTQIWHHIHQTHLHSHPTLTRNKRFHLKRRRGPMGPRTSAGGPQGLRRLDGDTHGDPRSGSCDKPPMWLSPVLTDDRHAASSCQLTSGRAKGLTLILTAGTRRARRKKSDAPQQQRVCWVCLNVLSSSIL